MKQSIGVIIPAHNAERLLPQTLASIQTQTVLPDKVIVVDDGSTDATSAIAKASGAHVIYQENRGVSCARNAGIRAIDTSYVAFCDADDIWDPRKLERQRDALLAQPECQFAFCDYYDFTAERVLHRSVLNDVLTHFDLRTFERLDATTYRCNRVSMNQFTLQHSFIMPSTVLMHNDLLQRLGSFKEGFVSEEDTEFLLRVFTQTDAVYIDEPLVGYRRHSANATGDPRRSRVGMLRLAALVIANANAYRPGSAEYYRSMFPTYLFRAGRMYASFGNLGMALWFLARSFEMERRAKTAVWYAIAPLFLASPMRWAARRARQA